MPAEGLSQADIELLGSYDSPTVCNVIELFDVQPRNVGYMNEQIKCCFPEMPPTIGYASTAQRRSDVAPRSTDPNVSLDAQVESFAALPGPAVVVYQDLDEPSVAATFGDIMCKTYKIFGAVGIITSGSGRDLDQVRELGFAAFTNGANPSHGYGYTSSIGGPVSVGGITIREGDLLFGDCNGVTTIPHEIADQVAHACADFAATESVILDYLDGNEVTVTGLAEARAECKRQQKELGVRLSRR